MSIDLLPQLKELRLYGIYEVWAVIKAEAQQGNKATSIAYEILFSQLINAKIIDLQTRNLKYKLQTDMILYIETWVNG